MRRRPRLTLINDETLKKIKKDTRLACFLSIISLFVSLSTVAFILIKLL